MYVVGRSAIEDYLYSRVVQHICFRVQCLTKFFLAFFQMAQLLMIEGDTNSDWPMFFERHKLKNMNQSEFA